MEDGVRTTTCVLDCPDTCALAVAVEDGRVTRIEGRRDHPDTAGFICGKVAAFGRRLDHAERVLYPLRRTGTKGAGTFERVSWEAALGEIAERLRAIARRWGGEAILPYHYGGSNGKLTDGLLDALVFARLGASRLDKTLCAAPTTAVARAMYGKMPGVAFGDYPEARCILVWGANPKGSNIHLVPYLREAKRRGAFVAAIDPRRTFSGEEIDLHLPVLPGMDLPLALGMIHLWEQWGRLDRAFLRRHTTGVVPLLERAMDWPLARAARESGVPAGDLQRLAEEYAERSPAVVRCGWGLERNRNGGQAVAAILALPALLGKFGLKGGGYTLSNHGAVRFDAAAVRGPLSWTTRRINMSRLATVLEDPGLEPPIRALFVYNANPLATVPDQNRLRRALAAEELFTVVSEQVMTDTARWADFVLPAVTFLEGHDLRVSYGSYVVGGARPVVEPHGEARSNMQLFAALGRALGFDDPVLDLSDEELLSRAVAALQLPDPVDAATLGAGGVQRVRFGGETPVQFGNVFPATADGRIDLTPAVLGPRPYRLRKSREEGSLALISPGHARLISSTLGEWAARELTITLSPEDAARRGVRSGDAVRVWNRHGEVVCGARVSERIRPGVAAMPKGAWSDASRNGSTSTALCGDEVNEVAGGACFNDARVEVERLA